MWLTINQVVELGRSKRRVEMAIAAASKTNSEWVTRDSGTRGRNGKPVREILLASLPMDLQRAWVARQSTDPDDVAGESEPTLQAEDGLAQLTKALSSYPVEEREAWIAEALRLNDLVNRYEAISPKRTRIAGGISLEFVPAVKALCKEAVCANEVILNALAQRSRREPKDRKGKAVSPHTLDQWTRKRKRVGLLAFIRSKSEAKKADDGRRADISPAALEWLETRWRRYPIVKQLYEKWETAAKQNGWRIPALSWLQRRWQQIPPVVRTPIFLGDKRYTDKFKPFLPRTMEDLEALQILCGDHHVLDVFCWSDKLKDLVRLWFTAWQDMRTGIIYGTRLDYTPSSFTIGCAYADGVRAFGAQPPSRDEYQSYIYVDNGKDYRSRNIKGEIEVHKQAAAINGGLELLLTQRGVGLIQDADVGRILARKFNGREKPLERTFRDLADFIQNEYFLSGWCGRNTKDKPDSYSELYARHKKAMKSGRKSPFPLESEVRIAVAEWRQRYNAKEHTRETLGGATVVPLQEYARLYTNRYDIREETLALMVMKTTRGPLRKNGAVALGSSYWHNELARWKGRRDGDGKPLQLEIRYLDSDYTTVWIVLPDGAICEAQRVDVGSVLTASRESLKQTAQRIRAEKDLQKNYMLLQQSIWRGETVEDRIVAELPVEEPVEMPIAVGQNGNQQSSVTLFTRFDREKHRAPVTRLVTAAEVSSIAADDGIFSGDDSSEDAGRGRVKEFDFDE